MNIRKKTALIAAAATAFVAVGCTANAKQWQEKCEAFQNSVVLINTFEVPQGKEAEALASWQKRVIFENPAGLYSYAPAPKYRSKR